MGVTRAFRKQNKTRKKKSKQDPNSVLIWISNQGLKKNAKIQAQTILASQYLCLAAIVDIKTEANS